MCAAFHDLLFDRSPLGPDRRARSACGQPPQGDYEKCHLLRTSGKVEKQNLHLSICPDALVLQSHLQGIARWDSRDWNTEEWGGGTSPEGESGWVSLAQISYPLVQNWTPRRIFMHVCADSDQ